MRNIRKNRADECAIRAGADHVAVGALAQYCGDRVNDNGFARTGLTGQDIEAALEENFRLLNDGNIFNMQNAQHAGFSSRKAYTRVS